MQYSEHKNCDCWGMDGQRENAFFQHRSRIIEAQTSACLAQMPKGKTSQLSPPEKNLQGGETFFFLDLGVTFAAASILL